MATKLICHWLKVQSRWFKNYIFAKKCILISFLIFKYCFYYSFTLFFIVPYFSLWTLEFSIPSEYQTAWNQIRPDKMSGLIWVQTVCKGYQLTTKVAPSRQRVKYKTTCWYYFLARALCSFYIWLQLFPLG